jgi:predicted RNA binding protein YcfA (HicA-like mRNA interferase family)
MPKLPRVTARQMLRALRRDGWQVESGVGSHLQLVHPSKPGKVTVPIHSGDIIGPKLFKSILTQAGLSPDEVRDLL